ncbi:MAG: hypothetical protein IKI11_02060 [Neisseriaceae bacterium]|nr:hypothetical protein [Neisseriaceae bacterium]
MWAFRQPEKVLIGWAFLPTATPQGVGWWSGERLILPCRASRITRNNDKGLPEKVIRVGQSNPPANR